MRPISRRREGREMALPIKKEQLEKLGESTELKEFLEKYPGFQKVLKEIYGLNLMDYSNRRTRDQVFSNIENDEIFREFCTLCLRICNFE